MNNPKDIERMLHAALVDRAVEVTAGALEWAADPAAWQQKRPEILEKFLYMLGLSPLPEKTPLAAEVTGRLQRKDYTVEMVVFQSRPGLYVTANLYLPVGRAEEPFPAIVYLCGHSDGGFAGHKACFSHHPVWYATHGYACLIIDTIQLGEIRGFHRGTHTDGLFHWFCRGYTPAGPEVWNAVRAMDYLETRPEIDMTRLGMTGISGGGTITWFTSAVDERVRALVPVCCTSTWHSHLADRSLDDHCDCAFYLNAFNVPFPEIFALCAPRPTMIQSTADDRYYMTRGYQEVYRKLSSIWSLYGKADQLQELEVPGPHEDVRPHREAAYRFFNHQFLDDNSPVREEEKIEEEAELLRCLSQGAPEDERVTGVQDWFVPRAVPPEPTERPVLEQYLAGLRKNLSGPVLNTLPKKVAFLETGDETHGFTIRSESGVLLPVTIDRPGHPDPKAPVVLRVLPLNSGNFYLPEIGKSLLLEGVAVIQAAIRGARPISLEPWEDAFLIRGAVMLGRSPAEQAIWDVLRVMEWAGSLDGLAGADFIIWGEGELGVAAAYSGIFSERISGVILERPTSSHEQGPILTNVLRYGDIPQLTALLAPRKIIIRGDSSAFEWTARAYEILGLKERFIRAGEKGIDKKDIM